MCGRRWSVTAGCNPVAARLSKFESYHIHQIWSRSINGDAVDCKSAAFGHAWFDPRILHQVYATLAHRLEQGTHNALAVGSTPTSRTSIFPL